jgi:DNA repair protein RecN (Recombination protein N)
MLRSLRIKNLALVDDLRWELGSGLNILTGETGAGKSILIGGLNLLIGERADKTLLRTGEDTCTVEAELELPKSLLPRLNTLLTDIGAEPCDGTTLLLKRQFAAAGTNKQFANGSPVTLAGLKQVGDLLVDVHGPHDHQSLLSTDNQRRIVDAYGKLDPLAAACRDAYDTLKKIGETLETLAVSERERALQIDTLTRQVEEISKARPKPAEDEQVDRDYRIAANARQILELAQQITQILGENDPAVLTQLAQVERLLHAWEKLDPSLVETAALNRSAVVQIQELLETVRNSAEKIDLDGRRLQELEDRLNLLQSLKRKYGPTLDDVIRFGEEAAGKLKSLESRDAEIERLKKEEAAAFAKLTEAAKKLSAARKKTAEPLAVKIQQELRVLGFQKAVFQIGIDTLADTPGRTGADAVEFIFAPNVGEEPRPLRAIASSGEMARVMLAVKTTLAEVDDVPILVFDEVDANVGGETATQVGKKLRRLGKSHQVLCITHLPQVAAAGDTHFAVEKNVKSGRTTTQLRLLEKKTRLAELARMLGGENKQSLALAENLLKELA